MSRPRKLRKVCRIPENDLFGPLMDFTSEIVLVTVDEYETIRLIDFEGLLQEECAKQMNVARTTVQSIYSEARKKIADAIVNRKTLKILGGNYILCDGNGINCHGKGCNKSVLRNMQEY